MKQLIKLLEKLKKILGSTNTTIVFSILFVIFFAIDFEIIASYLYGYDNPSNKGQLFGTALTAIGGVCVIWGLWLNNKKVNEQTRQNDIAVQSSNDKRFGEAIGYLNNDNEGIAIGGVYALYQLAKEDERYAPIVTDIFSSYLRNTDKEDSKSSQTIISLLFSQNNPFVSDKELVFTNLNFNNMQMFCTKYKVKFEHCSFYNTVLNGEDTVHFYNCSVCKSLISNFTYITIHKGAFSNMNIGNAFDCEIAITANILTNVQILITDITSLYINVKKIENVNIHTDTANDIYINNLTKEQIASNLFFHYYSEIKSIYIDDELVIDRSGLNLTRDDVMRRDKIYRWVLNSRNHKLQLIYLYQYNS